ncbi:MAG: hypothetical protein ABFD63_09485 [Smithella sp.]
MRGGYRPGSGRPHGAKDSKPRKGSKEKKEPGKSDKKRIQELLDLGTKAKARMYQDFLIRVSKGDKLSIAEKKMMVALGDELSADVKAPGKTQEVEKLDPLDYMLQVMNDPAEDKDMRARMATAAAPYVHARKGESKGKKDEKADRAKSAGAGRFASGKPPISLVK